MSKIVETIVNADWNKDCPTDNCYECENNHYNDCYKPATIKAEYNGYTGYAYGVRSFSLRDKDGKEIFHTGFCNRRPQNEQEVIDYIKKVLALREKIMKEHGLKDKEI